MSTRPFLGRAPPSTSIIQHSGGLTREGDCHLERKYHTTVPDYESAIVDTQEPQCLESSAGDGYSAFIPELLSCPVTPAPLLVCNSSLVGCLSGEPGTAQVARSLDYVVGENRASAIGHTSDYTNHDTTLPLSYTSRLPPYTLEQSSRHTWGSGDFSISGYLDNNLAGPMMGLGSIRFLHDHTYGQMELHPSGDFAHDNIPPEQTQAGMVVLPQLLSSFTMQSTEHIYPWTPFPYANPIPPQSNSTSYSNSDDYISSCSSLLMPNQNSSSWFPQEHLGYPLPVHPHYVRPVYLQGFHGIDSGRKVELHASGTLDDYAARVISDQSSHTPSDHKTHLRSHSTHVPDDHTTGGEVGDYGNFGERKSNSEQIVGLGPQLQLPPNQFSFSPRRRLSHDRVSRIKGKSLSRPFHHTSRPATARSGPKRPPKARSACSRNVSIPCGWRDDEGKKCGTPISHGDCTGHFATSHGIRNIAWNVRVICCWCPSGLQTTVIRKNFSRHISEVHLGCPRSENGI